MEFTNCSLTGNLAGAVEEYLQHLQAKTNITMIPAITMLCLFAITGLTGNSLVLVVYSKKFGINPTKILIMTIASFDLVANVAAIPIAIYTMVDTWNFKTAVVCKITASLGSFTAAGGAISLLVVAFIRYRKVCTPYDWQVTTRQAVVSSIVALLLAIMLSCPYFIIYGVKTRQTPCPNIQGSECFADDTHVNTMYPLLNNALFIMLYLFLSISLVVLYILVGKTARKHRQRHGISEHGTRALQCNVKAEAAATKKKLICCDVPTNKMSAKKMESVHRGRIHVLLCCSNQPEEQKSQDDTQSSLILKTYSTTSGEIVNTNPETDVEAAIVDNQKSESILNVAGSKYLRQRSQSTTVVSTDHEPPTDVRDEMTHLHYKEGSLNNDTQLSNDDSLDNTPNIRKYQNNSQQTKEVCINDFSSPSNASAKRHAPEPLRVTKTQQTGRTGSRTTVMLIVISSVYVLGFLPFLILTIFKNRLPETYANMNMIAQAFYNVFYRLYFLNSAANPIIYTYCDLSFRRECIRLVTCRSKKSLVINV